VRTKALLKVIPQMVGIQDAFEVFEENTGVMTLENELIALLSLSHAQLFPQRTQAGIR